MPLFNYQCRDCDWMVEKFVHSADAELEVICEECNSLEFEKVIGSVFNRTWLNAKDSFNNRITPEVERISKNISEGNDNDFLDIAGD